MNRTRVFGPVVRTMSFGTLLLCIGGAAHAGETPETGFLYEYLAGSYTVVGKIPDGDETYLGRIRLRPEGGSFLVEREIGGHTIQGRGVIETALGPDREPVLRVRFPDKGRDYEATYLWRSDLDNYPRLSGYVYRIDGTTAAPGLEALFVEGRK